MLLIIPSIEISDHKCRYRIQGLMGTEEYYEQLEKNPFDLCKLFRLENVKSIHIYDKDSFDDPSKNNFDSIARLTQATFLPFQVNGNFQTIDDCKNLLNYGVHRIILSDIAAGHPEIIANLIRDYSGQRIVFNLPVEKNNVQFKYTNKSYNLNYYIDHLKDLGATRIIYQPINESFNQFISDIKKIKLLKDNFQKWTLELDVSGFAELKQIEILTDFGVDSLIIGKPFFESVFPCQNIWRIAEKKLDIRDKL